MPELVIKFILALITGGLGGFFMAAVVIATGFRRQLDPSLVGSIVFLWGFLWILLA